MALELLDKVREAEENAARTVSEAQAQAREMIKGVEEACLNREREENAALRQMYQTELEKKRVAIAEEIAGRSKQNETLREKLRELGRANIPAAASMIFERITE